MMTCMKKADDHAFLCIQDFSSWLDNGVQTLLQIFHLLSESYVLATTRIGKQADGIIHISGICAFLSLVYTPPQVDKFVCKNRSVKAVGKGRWGARTSVALPMQDWPIYEGDQEKKGNRKADKTKADKTKSDKSKRENDKGLKKIKPPKRDG